MRSRAITIVSVYVVLGCIWILASDWLLSAVFPEPAMASRAQGYKGVFFILVTAAILFSLLAYRDRQIANRQAQLRLFTRYAPAALAMFDTRLHFLEVSERWLADFGLTGEEIRGRHHYDVFPEIPGRWREVHQRALRGEVLRSEKDRFVRSDGRVQWQRWEVRPWYGSDGAVGGILIFAEEITERVTAENELRIAAKAFETRQAMLITDADQRILRVNRTFCEITGFSAGEVTGKTPAVLQSGNHGADFYRELWHRLERDGEWQGEIWNRRRNGEIYPEWLHISRVCDADGAVTHYIGAFDDISEKKLAEEQIRSLSYYDALTQLPNRRLFADRLQQALRGNRRADRWGAVFILDLDDFGAFNDTRGHEVGDVALIAVARHLTLAAAGDDTVARIGSDEFAVVRTSLGDQQEVALRRASEFGQRLLDAVRRPVSANGAEYVITASIGISLFDGESDTVTGLLSRADAAMLQVKRVGRDCLHFFDGKMQRALQSRVELESALRRAIPDELRLFYQPQLDHGGRLIGAEALVRWQHPEKGLVPPGDFIPMAEESGLIVPMGTWILNSACEQLMRWQSQGAPEGFTLAVNISPRQYQRDDFVDLVLEALQRSSANSDALVLEITEGMLLDDIDRVSEVIGELRSRGLRFALDDFGTGFSSLSYLKNLQIDELKIDQSFVRNLPEDQSDAAIVETIITLGDRLGLSVIAEGVENEHAGQFLRKHGCNRFQGYFFSKPIPAEEFEQIWIHGTVSDRSCGALPGSA